MRYGDAPVPLPRGADAWRAALGCAAAPAAAEPGRLDDGFELLVGGDGAEVRRPRRADGDLLVVEGLGEDGAKVVGEDGDQLDGDRADGLVGQAEAEYAARGEGDLRLVGRPPDLRFQSGAHASALGVGKHTGSIARPKPADKPPPGGQGVQGVDFPRRALATGRACPHAFRCTIDVASKPGAP
jgi:hypothetical protein